MKLQKQLNTSLNNEDVWKNWTSSDARLAIKEELGMTNHSI